MEGEDENIDDFSFLLSLPVLSPAEGSKHEKPFSAESLVFPDPHVEPEEPTHNGYPKGH